MIGRRDFCLGLGAIACLPACRRQPGSPDAGARLPDTGPPTTLTLAEHGSGSARVVEVRWDRAVDLDGRVDPGAVEQMLDAALQRLTASRTPYSVWAGASRRLAIKVNSIDSQAFAHPEVAAALARGSVGAGSDPARVTVWDRDSSGLEARGYRLDASGAQGYRCLGTDAAGTDRPRSATVAGVKVYFSPLLCEADVLFNLAALKDHSMAGVTLTLKNNFGAIHGAERLHGNVARGSGCEPGISELAAEPEIRDRLQLGVIDALIGVCEGGPGPTDQRYAFRRGSLLLSHDPVALDRLGLAIIEARRAELGLVPLSERVRPNPSPPVHIERAAERLGSG